ncbi:unnamed protein product, partial [Iphiclides podalirius]
MATSPPIISVQASNLIRRCLFFLYALNAVVTVFGEDVTITGISDDLISELYSKYKEAVEDDSTVTTRRIHTRNHHFKIHIKKLKAVNGLKLHNLMIKEEAASETNPLIYIDNPVESKIPNAYLTLEEFKKALTNRIMSQREELTIVSNYALRTPKVVQTIPRKWSDKNNKTLVLINKKTPSTKSIQQTKNLMKTSIEGTNKWEGTNNFVTQQIENVTSILQVNQTTQSLERSTDSTTELISKETSTESTSEVSLTSLILESSTMTTTTTEFITEVTSKESSRIDKEVTKTTTRRTRRTLGRPLVFMGRNR